LVASVGTPFVIAEVASVAALSRASPDIGAFRLAAERFPEVATRFSLLLYARRDGDATRLAARMFAPLGGIMEDPATGSANAALAALLTSLPSEAKSGRTDPQFANRATDLLARTRLLMDSPAANEPAMRDLLEDLELVLAQVVRLRSNASRTELDIINRALEQRDVIPRLRTAVADISAN
jgi:hypothetical protein